MMTLDTFCSMIAKAWRRGNEPIILIDLIRKYGNKDISSFTFQKTLEYLGIKYYTSADHVLWEVYMKEPAMASGAQQDEMNIGSWSQKKIKTLTDSLDSSNSTIQDTEEVKETTAQGGKQTLINVRWDLLDPYAMNELVKLLYVGAEEYGENNWRQIPVQSHVNHAMAHLMNTIQILAVNMPDSKQEAGEELTHAFARSMFALGTL